MKRILKKTAEPNAMRYPGWEPGTGGGGRKRGKAGKMQIG